MQLYIAAPLEGIHRPVRELKGFEKVFLKSGERKRIYFTLDERSFSIWNNGWVIPEGIYKIEIGASSEDIRLSEELKIEGEVVTPPVWQKGSWYESRSGLPSDKDFCASYGGDIQLEPLIKKGSFTMEMSSMEMKEESFIMKIMYWGTEKTIAKAFGGVVDYNNPSFKMLMMMAADSPLRASVISSGGTFPDNLAEGILEIANGHLIRGLKKMMKKKKTIKDSSKIPSVRIRIL